MLELGIGCMTELCPALELGAGWTIVDELCIAAGELAAPEQEVVTVLVTV